MIVDLEIYQPAPLEDLSTSELHVHINRVLEGDLPGFVLAASMTEAFSSSVAYAQSQGLEGGVNSTTMTFNYDNTSDHLTSRDAPGPEDWESLGITPLHSDGEEGDRMLSINQALAGAYDIMIFGRGPKIAGDMPIELWDSLQDENMGVLLGGKVDSEMLATRATRLAVSAGQTIVFNPSQPHMGVTREAPRRSNATFFHDVA
jgi:hypothetical protein